MLQPERNYTIPPASEKNSYRFGLNGQEKTKELGENFYEARYWEYDARIGRRWNRDPKPSVDISPYATFANNPLCYSDPFGDTLSDRQLVDALKIANTEIKNRVKKSQGFYNDDAKNSLGKTILEYQEKNQLNFGDLAAFNTAVDQYYNGFRDISDDECSGLYTLRC